MTASRARSHPMTELSSFHFQSSILCSFLFFQNPHSASLDHLQKYMTPYVMISHMISTLNPAPHFPCLLEKKEWVDLVRSRSEFIWNIPNPFILLISPICRLQPVLISLRVVEVKGVSWYFIYEYHFLLLKINMDRQQLQNNVLSEQFVSLSSSATTQDS